VLEIRGLAKSWPGFRLDVGFSVERGEIAALLGPSGTGKSTLLRLIAGLEAPDSGSIFVAGREVTGLPPERRGIGMVFQDYALFPHLSVRRNIEYGPMMRGVGRALRRREARAIAASFEIESLLERSPYSLSGGEQQRVALARALAADPAILLLDEPLSSLDASLRLRLRAEIGEKLKKAGMTALLVTHDAKEAFAVADRIFLMRSGSIDAEGRPEALFESPPTAWSASFLGRGPVLEILDLEGKGGSHVAMTAIGAFACSPSPAGASGAARLSLYFPAEAPRIAPPAASRTSGTHNVMRNLIRGRVAASSFEGKVRRISLACPVVAGPGRNTGDEVRIELEMPSRFRPSIGEILECEIEPDRCLLLPGSISQPDTNCASFSRLRP
jgi:ABC-type Fe3+/spermidine/putrescine transport system ATPase subunit